MSLHREKYLSYDGPLRPTGGWWVLAAQTVRSTAGYLRTKLVVPLLWIPPLIASLLLVAQFVFQDQAGQVQAPGGGGMAAFLQVQFYSLAVLYAVSCGRVVSHDLRYHTLELYFSKPIETWEYTAGKILGLILTGSVVTVGPAAVVGFLRVALYSQHGLAGTVAADVGIGLGLSVAITVVAAVVMVGLSSLTSRTGFVVLAWVGVIFVPLVAAVVVGLSTEAADYAALVSMQGSLGALTASLLELGSDPLPVWMSAGTLLCWGAGGLGLHVWRVRNLEEAL